MMSTRLHFLLGWSLTASAAAKEGKKLVVIGSSFIGMEIVITALKRKLASIDVIGRGGVPFEPILGKDVGGAIQKVEPMTKPFSHSLNLKHIVP